MKKNSKVKIAFILSLFIFLFLISKITFSQNVPPPPGISTFSIPLKTGWNMISIPVDQTQETLSSQPRTPVLSDIKGCSIGAIWEFSPSSNTYIQPATLSPMKGYWVFSENDCNATITGKRSYSLLNLTSGWNMISSKFSWNQISETGNPRCNLISPIYYYDPSRSNYITVSTNTALEDNKGYWIYVNNNCSLKEPSNFLTCPNIVFPEVMPPEGCHYEYQRDQNGCVIGRTVVCPPSSTQTYPPVGLGNVVTDRNLLSPVISSSESSLMQSAVKDHLQYYNNMIYLPVFDLNRGEIKLYAFDTGTKKWSWPYKTFTFEQKPGLFRTLKEKDNLYFVMLGGTSGGILKYNITQNKFENWKLTVGSIISPQALVSVYNDDIYLVANKQDLSRTKWVGGGEAGSNNLIYVLKLNKTTGEFVYQYSGSISNSYLKEPSTLLKGNNVLNGEIYFITYYQGYYEYIIILNTYNIAQKRFYRELEVSSSRENNLFNILNTAQFIFNGQEKIWVCNQNQCITSSGQIAARYNSGVGASNIDIYSLYSSGSAFQLLKNNSAIASYESYLNSTLQNFYGKYCPIIGDNMWCLVRTSDNKLNFVIIGIN